MSDPETNGTDPYPPHNEDDLQVLERPYHDADPCFGCDGEGVIEAGCDHQGLRGGGVYYETCSRCGGSGFEKPDDESITEEKAMANAQEIIEGFVQHEVEIGASQDAAPREKDDGKSWEAVLADADGNKFLITVQPLD